MIVLVLVFSSQLCSLGCNFQLCAGAGYQPITKYITVSQADVTFCILVGFFFFLLNICDSTLKDNFI